MKRRADETKILVIRFKLAHGSRDIHAEIFLTNPTSSQMQALLQIKASEIERAFAPLCSQTEVITVTAEFSEGTLVPKFAIRADGVPFDPSGRLITYKGELPRGISIAFQDEQAEE